MISVKETKRHLTLMDDALTTNAVTLLFETHIGNPGFFTPSTRSRTLRLSINILTNLRSFFHQLVSHKSEGEEYIDTKSNDYLSNSLPLQA